MPYYALLLPPIAGALVILVILVIACWDYLTGRTRREREAEQARLDAEDIDRRFEKALREWDRSPAGKRVARIAQDGAEAPDPIWNTPRGSAPRATLKSGAIPQ